MLNHKNLSFSFAIISFLGFLDATYITARHYLGLPLPCSLIKGCEKVTTSQYATIGGIPVALLGALYYFAILILTLVYIDIRKQGILNFVARLTLLGFIASFWFVYLQLFVIGAICLYCIFSAVDSTLLFIFGIYVLKLKNKNV